MIALAAAEAGIEEAAAGTEDASAYRPIKTPTASMPKPETRIQRRVCVESLGAITQISFAQDCL